MNRLQLRAAVRVLVMTAALACDDATSLPRSTQHEVLPPNSPPPNGPSPSNPSPSGRTIRVGEDVSGTITGLEPECHFTTEDGGWGGVCDAYEISVESTGTLETSVSWTDLVPLIVFVKTSTGRQIDMTCCSSPQTTIAVPVDSGSSYRLEVAYAGRPPGYPSIAPVKYALTTRLLSPPDTATTSSRMILYADATRTQRMSTGRVEIIEGSYAGTTATFDSVGGTYGFRGLPRSYVQIRASADLFHSVTERVPIGVNVAQSVVLERLVPLVGATHTLAGMTWASANSAYAGVKVEILDGPHAGAFTFSLDDWGSYHFQSLSPGRIRVRASREGLAPQTLEVTVSGTTILHFRW